MIRIREIDHLVLRVINLSDMIAFYRDVLGCRVEKRQTSIGLTQLRAGNSLLDLVEVNSKLGRTGGAAPGQEGLNLDHFCFRIHPFDAAEVIKHLQTFGLEPGEVASRYGAEGFGESIYVNDPEGNTVELKGPPDPLYSL